MDLDDLGPQKSTGICIGDDLSRLSVDELEERVLQLQQEIARVGEEISAKKSTKAAAESVFKI